MTDNVTDNLKPDVIYAIAVNSPFDEKEVKRVYDIFNSFDLMIEAIKWCAEKGYNNLETACILVKGKLGDVPSVDKFLYGTLDYLERNGMIHIKDDLLSPETPLKVKALLEGENIFHIEYVEADIARLTKVEAKSDE